MLIKVYVNILYSVAGK